MAKGNYKYLGLILSLILLSTNCSLDVKKAIAPTAPPQAEKSIFSASQIRGHYQTDGSPKMFKWPDEKWSEDKTQWIPMSFSEKVKTRQIIMAYSEDVELYTQQYTDLENELTEKYDNLLKGLEATFTEKKCYSYCDADSLFCDPTDTSVLNVDDWKQSEDEEEIAIITSCQDNQSQRESIANDFNEEVQTKVEPLRIKAGDAALALLQTVGDHNYFTELTSFEIFFGPFVCVHKEGCRRDEALNRDNIYIRIQMGDITLTNFDGNSEALRVYDVDIDSVQGFLVFKTPATDFENSNNIYGEIVYDLEFINGNNATRVDGDIRVLETQNGKEKVGRFSSIGQITN